MGLALFTNRYLSVGEEESAVTKEYMYINLQELMDDVEVYGWKSGREYYAA